MEEVDYLRAYDLPLPTDDVELIRRILHHLEESNPTVFQVVRDVISDSSRDAATVTHKVKDIGMEIPHKYRYGIRAYEYFLDNIRLYSSLPVRSLNVENVLTASNPEVFLQSFSDRELASFQKVDVVLGRRELIQGALNYARGESSVVSRYKASFLLDIGKSFSVIGPDGERKMLSRASMDNPLDRKIAHIFLERSEGQEKCDSSL